MGTFEPIRLSGIQYRQQSEARVHVAFEFYDTHRKSAEEDPNTGLRLIHEDIEEFRDDIAQGKQSWPKGVAVGRFTISRSEHRNPRLSLNSDIPNQHGSPNSRKIPQPARGGHRLRQRGITLIRGNTTDVEKHTKDFASAKTNRMLSPVPAARQAPPPTVRRLGAQFSCMVEPHGCSAHTHLPPVPFHFSAR